MTESRYAKRATLAVATDVSMELQLRKPGSRTQAAAIDLIDPLLEAHPDVSAAAAAAATTAAAEKVDDAIAAADLVKGVDPRLPQQIGNIPGWVHLNTTADGWILSGQTTTGPYSFFASSSPARTLDPIVVPGYRNVVLDKTATYVIEYDKTDGTKYFDKLRVRSLDIENSSLSRELATAAWGDSMTDDYGNTGTSTAAVIGTASGYPVYTGGVSGQTSSEILFRLGATQLSATIVGGSIPASGAVEVVLRDAGFWATGTAWDFDVTVRIRPVGSAAATTVNGTLRKATDNTWTFTASGLGAAVAAPLEVLFVSRQGLLYSQRGVIFRAGRNNEALADPNFVDNVARDYRAARAFVYATQSRPRFLALPIYNPRSATAGTSRYDLYAAANAAIAKEASADYYDLRRWMIRNGLAAANITPASQDTTDIANDTIPTSLSYIASGGAVDGTHLSPTARLVEGRQIAFVITLRGWFA